MARNTKPVPLAEKGWAITMKKISIILLSAVLVFSMAACNGGKEKADNQTEKQTESVKPTEEAEMATEAVTEVTTEAGSEETEKDIAEVKDSEEKNDKEDNRSADNETASRQEEKPKQNDEPEQKASVNDNEEAGGNQSNAGNGGQTIVADIFGTGSGDSAARKLCNTAPSPDSSYSYYERLRDNISSSYNATLPSFASRRISEAPTYELKWNEGSQRFETTLSDSNGVLSDFDFGISGYSVDKNGNSITISSTSVNTTATTGTFTSNAGKVETTSSCVFWLTGKSGYQEFISERPTADPIKAYIKVKTENIGYGELTKTDESSGVKLSGAVYGIYSDSGCTNRVQTMTTDGNGYAKSAALVAGTYYVKEITAPKGYVLSGKVHTLTVKAGQTTGISATDKEQLGAITIYKEGEAPCSLHDHSCQ